MNEPLNHQCGLIWPDWHQKPIRLTVPEIENPASVLDQFFQCFHLPDIRRCLKLWLQDALTKETVESKQHIATHDEIEKLVEAAWVLNTARASGTWKNNQAPHWSSIHEHKHKSKFPEQRYKKKELLIEKVSRDPVASIHEVFQHNNIGDFLDFLLPNWLRTALINNQCRYSDGGLEREILCEFYDYLLLLIQALNILNERNEISNGDVTKTEEWLRSNKRYDIPFLTDGQLSDPTGVISGFFETFSIEYVRRELRDFVDAGVGYDGSYPNAFTPWFAFMTYEYVLCLVEAAYKLHHGNKEKLT